MAVPVNHIFVRASQLLDAVVDGYSVAGVSLPARQYISEGDIAWDCELAAIRLLNVFRGTPGAEIITPGDCFSIRTAAFSIEIVRCAAPMHDDGSPPNTAAIETVAEAMMTDAWLLPYSLATELADTCRDITIGPVIPKGPEGGYTGVSCAVFWTLGGD